MTISQSEYIGNSNFEFASDFEFRASNFHSDTAIPDLSMFSRFI
jgi:hypothetical protein